MAKTPSSDDEDPELTSLYSAVGARIKELRVASGLTQEQLSDRSGVSRRYIVQIERMGLNLTLELLHQLAKALGLKLQDLVNFPQFDYSGDDEKLTLQKHQFKGILASIESFVREQVNKLEGVSVSASHQPEVGTNGNRRKDAKGQPKTP